MRATTRDGIPTALAISGSTSFAVNTCKSFTVSLKDDASGLASANVDTVVALSGQGSGTFYANSACSTPAALTIPTGQASGKFYFKSSVPEALVFGAAADGLAPATLNVIVN